jgi:hypothetical protein
MFGLFGGSDVKPDLVQIDQQTLTGLDDLSKQASQQSVGAVEQGLLKGVGGPKDYTQQIAQQEKALGGYEPGMSGAIQNKYKSLAGEGIERLKTQAKLKSFDMKSQQLQRVGDLKQAKNQIDAENKRRQYEADLANEQARNSALASVLGIGAVIAGNALAGPIGGGLAGTVVKGGEAGGSYRGSGNQA